jgi:hypothetical protein
MTVGKLIKAETSSNMLKSVDPVRAPVDDPRKFHHDSIRRRFALVEQK